MGSGPTEKIPLRVFAVRNKPYGVYDIITDPNDFILRKLPTDLKFTASKPNPDTTYPNDYNSIFVSPEFRSGYDSNGVSNNLLNNIITTSDLLHYDPYNFADTETINTNPLRYTFKHLSPALIPVPCPSRWSQFFYSGSSNVILDSNNLPYYDSEKASNETVSYGPNEFIFTNWFRAGAKTNLFTDSTILPSAYPEQVILPSKRNDFSDFSYTNEVLSPFTLCLNVGAVGPTDVKIGYFEEIDINLTSVIGIPFLPPQFESVLPTKIVVKFAYVQPLYNSSGIITRNSTLSVLGKDNFTYNNGSSSTKFNSVDDKNKWDDHFIANRKNAILGVFYCKDINGRPLSSIKLTDALSTLTLKKVVQSGAWNSSQEGSNNKKRSPEWGTYYVYEKSDVSQNIWVPYEQIYDDTVCNTKWVVLNKQADYSKYSYSWNIDGNPDTNQYYSNVKSNSMCFIPFYPVFNEGDRSDSGQPIPKNFDSWAIGNFSGLSYTSRPYVPFASSISGSLNPYLYYKPSTIVESICIEDISGAGLSQGMQSNYYGICGPFIMGGDVSGNLIIPDFSKKPLFFNVRVNLIKHMRIYNPITDLTMFRTPEKCFVNTQMYLYNEELRPGSSLNDINNGWGQEKATNFTSYDDSSGYNYQSFLNKCDVDADFNYNINIRSVLPTAALKSTLRISGKNWTDFGLLSLRALGQEIDDLISNGVQLANNGTLINDIYRKQRRYTYNYTVALLNFNTSFIGSFTFGVGFASATYSGLPIISTGFTDFIDKYVNQYRIITNTVKPIQNAQSSVAASMTRYISKNYAGILPESALRRNLYTEPLLFSILFKYALNSKLANSFDNWGLGWNLGYDKIDTILSTRHVSHTFVRIIDDFIYLKLNEEFNINTIDISEKEYLNKNRDTAGRSNSYFGKLLLNTFGSYSQTFIQSSKGLIVPLSKLDKLTFTLVDANNNAIINPDCEFNVVIDVGETLDTLDPLSVIVKGSGSSSLAAAPVAAPVAASYTDMQSYQKNA